MNWGTSADVDTNMNIEASFQHLGFDLGFLHKLINYFHKHPYNHSLLDSLDLYLQFRENHVLLPWTEAPFFVFCVQNYLAFLMDFFFPPSDSAAL